MNLYSKPYISNGGYKCRMCYHFSLSRYVKNVCDKKFGYWYIYYDGYFHNFSIYPIVLSWYKRPEMID